MSNIHPIELKRRLRRLSRALNTQTSDINCGGCAVMAGIVGGILELLGVPVEVVTSSEYGCAPAAARQHLHWNIEAENDGRWDNSAWDSAGVSRAHLAVRFMLGRDLYTWDSDGLIKSDKYFGRHYDGEPLYCAEYPFGDGMTVAECVHISSTPEDWNYMFDRRQIPRMRKLAYQHLLN